ncbi:Uncharacterized protein Adt_37254 [Abeliophyllum distichum]|uniref:Uncharacterized protein n=1 Tax=Abeliophyllum distichum TaxID=126358 RepID=A0ABD1QK56_9LAMI
MKHKEMENEVKLSSVKKGIPPPLPPLPRFVGAWERMLTSPTKQEIANYWEKKHVVEEYHLLRAAARIRAKKLFVKYSAQEEDYKPFDESLKEDDHSEEINKSTKTSVEEDEKKETRVGIKDW